MEKEHAEFLLGIAGYDDHIVVACLGEFILTTKDHVVRAWVIENERILPVEGRIELR